MKTRLLPFRINFCHKLICKLLPHVKEYTPEEPALRELPLAALIGVKIAHKLLVVTKLWEQKLNSKFGSCRFRELRNLVVKENLLLALKQLLQEL